MSYPAARAEPLVGAFAEAESFLTSSGGDWDTVVTGVSLEDGLGGGIGLGRLGRGEVGNEGGRWDDVNGGVPDMFNELEMEEAEK